jgi:ParB-like chromosome segregation protein Spo0J
MKVRDRIKGLRRVRASELKPNARNWRTHPPEQRDALMGVLAEIGMADALIARELPDKSLELIDGHLRADTLPDQKVPVLVVDLTEEEAAKLLLTLDPMASLATRDDELLADLIDEVQTDSPAVQAMIDQLGADLSADLDAVADEELDPAPQLDGTKFQIIVECSSEKEQRRLLESFEREGIVCRALIF